MDIDHCSLLQRSATLAVALILSSAISHASVHDMMEDEWPLLLSFSASGPTLTKVEEGVLFDGDADGVVEPLEWTAENTEDAWLVLDRNGNGLIDDSKELFGVHCPNPDAGEPNGYRALAMLDRVASGGNDDDRISAADAAFELLRLWFDRNKNGLSEVGELVSLGDAGITWIGLKYQHSGRPLANGSHIQYTGFVFLDDHRIVPSATVLLRKLDL